MTIRNELNNVISLPTSTPVLDLPPIDTTNLKITDKAIQTTPSALFGGVDRPNWDYIGNDISTSSKVSDALTASKLDFTVTKEPIFQRIGGNFLELPDNFVTTSDDGHTFGLVGSKYEILQNAEAFSFLDDIPDLNFKRGGMTHNGLVYMIAEMTQTTILDDPFTVNLIVQNGHAGNSAFAATFVPLRIACQNQFAMSFKNSPNTIRLRHTSSITWRMEAARKTMANAAEYLRTFAFEAEKLAGKKVTRADVERVCFQLFPSSDEVMTAIKATRMDEARSAFFKAYDCDDNANFQGSAWGIVNAYGRYVTHNTRFTNNDRGRDNLFAKTALSNPMNVILEMVA